MSTTAPAPSQDGNERRGGLLRVVRLIGWTSITLGVLILGFVAHQLWVTSFFAERHQTVLEEELEEAIQTAGTTEVAYDSATGKVIEVPAGSQTSSDPGWVRQAFPDDPTILPLTMYGEVTAPGSALGEIRIPAIDVEWTFVAGTTLAQLKNGAGHMPGTALPGLPGNSVISGHRTTYGQPFHDLDLLAAGDRIEVETAIGTHVYAVRTWEETVDGNGGFTGRPVELIDGTAGVIVRPTALWVTDELDGAWLTLTTCHPKRSAAKRLIIFAELVDGPNAPVILRSS